MARLSDIARGLTIIGKYDDREDRFSVTAAHDIIFAGKTPPERMEMADQTELRDLGWDWSASYDCWTHHA